MGTIWTILKSFGVSFVIAAFFFVFGFRLLAQAIAANESFEILKLSAGFMLCFGAGAVSIAFRIDRYITDFVGSIFFPGEEYDRPQPLYSIPEGKRKTGHYQEAFDEFQQIAAQYPQELKAYIEMMDIAIVDMKDKKKANLVFHQAIAALDKREDCDTILKMYKAISSRLDINLHAAHHPVELKKQSKELSEPDYYR